MKYPRWSKLLSLFLVLAMLLQMMPVVSFAAEDDDDSTVVDTASGSPVITVLGEVEDLREENTKHFRLSDGSFVAVNYGLAVHYEDDNGNWQDIDNTISEDAIAQTFDLERDDAIISFASSLTNGKVLTTSKDGASITMRLLDSAEALRLIAASDSEEVESEETLPMVTEPELTEPTETQYQTEPEETVSETTEAEVTETEQTDPVATEEPSPDEETVAETDSASEDPSLFALEDSETEGNTSFESEPIELTVFAETEPTTAETTEAEETKAEEMTSETTVSEEDTTDATEPDVTEESATVPTETQNAETAPEETEAAETLPEVTQSIETTPAETTDVEVTSDGLVYNRNASAEIKEDQPTLLELQESTSWNIEDVIPSKLQSSLIYENVFPDTDLLYTAYGHNIKEQIIVRQHRCRGSLRS